ncbi:unnamed protein product [Diatraea saccharalis]|uniref:Chitin-binding type-2 domain-containing protein n=1 Tax=Diatraea saccharalis TaxID=40085 RepID=A0A9N9R940_9NEOP|nr:unnamed protein product [Diatraea saccharalis]
MPFTKRKMIEFTRILTLILIVLPMVSANVDCGGKAFHCVNITHFMICVDLGGGVTSTIDTFVIPCPLSTECRRTNRYECEFPKPVTLEKISVPEVNVFPAVATYSATSIDGSSSVAEFSQYVTGSSDPSMTELPKVAIDTKVAKSDFLESSTVSATSTTDFSHIFININIKNQTESDQTSTNTDVPYTTEFFQVSTNTSILNNSFQNLVDNNLSNINDLKNNTVYNDINTMTEHRDYIEISTDTNLSNRNMTTSEITNLFFHNSTDSETRNESDYLQDRVTYSEPNKSEPFESLLSTPTTTDFYKIQTDIITHNTTQRLEVPTESSVLITSMTPLKLADAKILNTIPHSQTITDEKISIKTELLETETDTITTKSDSFQEIAEISLLDINYHFQTTTDTNVLNKTEHYQSPNDSYNKNEPLLDFKDEEVTQSEISQKSQGISITSTNELFQTTTDNIAVTNKPSYQFLLDTIINVEVSEIATDSLLNLSENIQELTKVTTPRITEYLETTSNSKVTNETKPYQYSIDFTRYNNTEPIEMASSTNISNITEIKASPGVSVLSTTENFQSSTDTSLPFDNKFPQQNEVINTDKVFQSLSDLNIIEHSISKDIKSPIEIDTTRSTEASTVWNENNDAVTKQFPWQELENVSSTLKRVIDQIEETTTTNINFADTTNIDFVTEYILNRELNQKTTIPAGIIKPTLENEAATTTSTPSFYGVTDDNSNFNASNKVEMPLSTSPFDAYYKVPNGDRLIYTTEKQFSTFSHEIPTENFVVTKQTLINDVISSFDEANIFTSEKNLSQEKTTKSNNVINMGDVNVSGNLMLNVNQKSKETATLSTIHSNSYATESSFFTNNHKGHNFEISSTISYTTVTPYTYDDVTQIEIENIAEKPPMSSNNDNIAGITSTEKSNILDVLNIKTLSNLNYYPYLNANNDSINLIFKNENMFTTTSYENRTTELNDTGNIQTSVTSILDTNLKNPTTNLELLSTTKDFLKPNSNTHEKENISFATSDTEKSIKKLNINSNLSTQITSMFGNSFYINTIPNTQVTTKKSEYIGNIDGTTSIGQSSDYKSNIGYKYDVTESTVTLNTDALNYQTLKGSTDNSANFILPQMNFIKSSTEVSEIKKQENGQDLVNMQHTTERLTGEKNENNLLVHIIQATPNFSMSGFQTDIEQNTLPLNIDFTTFLPPLADFKPGVNVSETKTYSEAPTNKIFDKLFSSAENKSNSQNNDHQLNVTNSYYSNVNSTQSLQHKINTEQENNIIFNATYKVQINPRQIVNNNPDANKAVNKSTSKSYSGHFNVNRNTTSKTYIYDVNSKKTTIDHIKSYKTNNNSEATPMSNAQSEQNIPSDLPSLGIVIKQHGKESLSIAKTPEQQRNLFENHESNITLSRNIVNNSLNSQFLNNSAIPLNTNLTSKKYNQSISRDSRFNILQLRDSVGNLTKLLKPSRQTTGNNYETINRNTSHIPGKRQGNVTKLHFTCRNRNRGRYSDVEDCNIFYICIGKLDPIIGRCPAHTVFSDIRKQCTKNISHCIRGSEFKCTKPGRFLDILKRNFYYICVRKREKFLKFKFQCLNGYYLNETLVQCVIETQSESQHSISFDSNGDLSNINNENTPKTNKREFSNKSQKEFSCGKEGKFADEDDCNRYYVCTKNKKFEFRKRKKKCESDEVFHKEKKTCVDADSYEC